MSATPGWHLDVRHWRWVWRDSQGRVGYWISTEAAGTEFDNRAGFVSEAGERVPPLPGEAYPAVGTEG